MFGKGFKYLDTEEGQKIKVFNNKPRGWYYEVFEMEQVDENLVVYERNPEAHAGRGSRDIRVSVLSPDSVSIKSKEYICGCNVGLERLRKTWMEDIAA